jgi:hypothetical protein
MIMEIAALSDGPSCAYAACGCLLENLFSRVWKFREDFQTYHVHNDQLMLMFDETLLELCKKRIEQK